MADERILIAGTIDAFYRILSGDGRRRRDWAAMRSLFCAGASIIPYGPPPHGLRIHVALDAETYVTRLERSRESRAFHERGVDYSITVNGDIAQVWSRYEASQDPGFANLLKSGTNLIHLIRESSDWKIAGMVYADDPSRAPG